MTSAAPARHASSAAPRHHPYAGPSTSSSAAASSSGSSSKDVRKAHRVPPSHKDEAASGSRMPPSPPRSNRDLSEAPSLGLNVAFGSNGGSKWWDEELPAPPASLTSILDSFRKSGEGDRELLLSILGAKKAEEERLTALITTRLTVLQARLSLHSAAAAALQSATPSPMPPVHPLPPQHPGQHLAVPGGSTSSSSSPRLGPSSPHHLPPYGAGAAPSSGPMRPSRSHSPPPHTFPYAAAAAAHHHAHHHHHRSHSRVELPALSLPGDRTPSLTSRGSDASSIGAVSPSSEHGKYNPLDDPRAIGQTAAGTSASAKVANPDLDRYRAAVQPASSSVGTTSFWRRSPEGDDVSASVSLPPIRPRVSSGGKKDEDGADRNASLSPKSAAEGRSFNGIDMLLDAGRRAVM